MNDFGSVLGGAAMLALGGIAIFGQRDLDRPGEVCSQVCVPLPGYHFEMLGRDPIAVHDAASRDGSDTQFALFMQDADTAEKWSQLTTAQQQAIRDGKQTIYAYVAKESEP